VGAAARQHPFGWALHTNNSLHINYILLFQLIFIIHISVALAFGAKESSTINNLFTFLNLGVVLYVIITGAFQGEYFIGF
jgi:amino acid transporter